MEPAPKIMEKLAAFLKSNGHECVQIIGVSNHKFKWCEQDDCPETRQWEDMKKRQLKEEKFASDLQKRGHKCIWILESYPMRVEWCEKEPCVKK